MADIRLQRMAKVLVNYSLNIKKGDRFAIYTSPLAAPLLREVMREALRAGAHPEPFISVPGIQELMLKEGSDEQLRYIPAAQRLVIEEYEARLTIMAQENTKNLNGVDPARLGEFAFGNNRNVDRCTKNILFDEKMGGTIHLALGASIPQTLGVNQSALHWDMVCDLRSGSEIRVDDELFCKDGVFVV